MYRVKQKNPLNYRRLKYIFPLISLLDFFFILNNNQIKSRQGNTMTKEKTKQFILFIYTQKHNIIQWLFQWFY